MIFPSYRRFREFSRFKKRIPVATCLPLCATACDLFEAVRFLSFPVLLESARLHPVTGRYSLIVAQPREVLFAKGNQAWIKTASGTSTGQGDPLEILQGLLDSSPTLRLAGLPPFVGGAVGFFGFDASGYIEPLPRKAVDDLNLPDLGFLFYEEVVVVDHLKEKLWVIALSHPSERPEKAYEEAVERVQRWVDRLTCPPDSLGVSLDASRFSLNSAWGDCRFRLGGSGLSQATHTRASFEAMVREAKDFIAEGQIYQANLSLRFAVPLSEEPWALYRALRAINPSPFSAYADFGDFQIVCSSPERFLRLRGDCVETRPIAGTRPKGRTAVEAARLRQELVLNEKERAEHLMLVDLERNDLGRVCRYGTVRVDEFMVLEEYSHVIHIVSNVRGTLRLEVRAIDLIRATFPGGTITGCPKIRCLQIIDELEPVRRQLYTGALGYIGFTGEIDFNLLIRTALVANQTVYVQAGAGIVADSDPSKEYEESLHKARALREALHADFPEETFVSSYGSS